MKIEDSLVKFQVFKRPHVDYFLSVVSSYAHARMCSVYCSPDVYTYGSSQGYFMQDGVYSMFVHIIAEPLDEAGNRVA